MIAAGSPVWSDSAGPFQQNRRHVTGVHELDPQKEAVAVYIESHVSGGTDLLDVGSYSAVSASR
jgi:hypothetical protein